MRTENVLFVGVFATIVFSSRFGRRIFTVIPEPCPLLSAVMESDATAHSQCSALGFSVPHFPRFSISFRISSAIASASASSSDICALFVFVSKSKPEKSSSISGNSKAEMSSSDSIMESFMSSFIPRYGQPVPSATNCLKRCSSLMSFPSGFPYSALNFADMSAISPFVSSGVFISVSHIVPRSWSISLWVRILL